jgi:hypothetical protein
MRKACHDAGGSKRDAQKFRDPEINALAATRGRSWSTFGHLRHAFGQPLSKKRHFFPAQLGKKRPQQASE